MRELQARNTELGGDVRVIKFPRGRYKRHRVRNEAAMGNASPCAEPLEATPLKTLQDIVNHWEKLWPSQ